MCRCVCQLFLQIQIQIQIQIQDTHVQVCVPTIYGKLYPRLICCPDHTVSVILELFVSCFHKILFDFYQLTWIRLSLAVLWSLPHRRLCPRRSPGWPRPRPSYHSSWHPKSLLGCWKNPTDFFVLTISFIYFFVYTLSYLVAVFYWKPDNKHDVIRIEVSQLTKFFKSFRNG